MFYEEKEMGGVVFCRNTPNGIWRLKSESVYYTMFYGNFRVNVSFDNKEETRKSILEQIRFWMGADERLMQSQQNPYLAYAKMLAAQIYNDPNQKKELGLSGIKKRISETEGWYPVDGSVGVTLNYVNFETDVDEQDFDIQVTGA